MPLPGLPELGHAGEPDLHILAASAEDVDAAWSGPASEPAVAEADLDGGRYRAERGRAGDHRFSYGDRATFHLDDRARTLLCAPAAADDPSWRRVLLDSVLATASLLHGFEALHAAAVAGSDGAVAFIGRTGGGKSTLAAELVRRGLPLVADDVLALGRSDGAAIEAHAAPPVMNLPLAAGPIGEPLATFGEETWVVVDNAAEAPAPVAAVCLIDRRPRLEPSIRPSATSAVDLLAHGLRSGSTPERLQSRFELLADLAEQTPAYVLAADPATPANRLADLAEASMPSLRPLPAGAAR